jgi:hypothetical protein
LFSVRSAAERLNSRAEATVVLATLIPDLAGNVVGRANAPKENQDDLVKNRKNEMGIEMLIVQRGKDAAGSSVSTVVLRPLWSWLPSSRIWQVMLSAELMRRLLPGL